MADEILYQKLDDLLQGQNALRRDTQQAVVQAIGESEARILRTVNANHTSLVQAIGESNEHVVRAIQHVEGKVKDNTKLSLRTIELIEKILHRLDNHQVRIKQLERRAS